MANTENDLRIDYTELPATNLKEMKRFYSEVFGWSFHDFGEDYIAFSDGRISGGFYSLAATHSPGVLVVVYAVDLAETERKVLAAGGKIIRPVFDFPGGRRFHFTDPSGNELAVWSEVEEG